jgi:CheY-like chemotaxis protein
LVSREVPLRMFSVCVIDEDVETVEALRTVLGRLGCEVVLSEGSHESIQRLTRAKKVDAAFVSLGLRGASACGVARRLRACYPSSKVFFLTNWEGELDREALDSVGICEVIRKPPRFSDVKRILLEHLG